MILIYTHTNSPRLHYICAFIFTEQLGIEYEITTIREKISFHSGPKINYSNEEIPGSYTIESTSLLFEKSITQQKPVCFQEKEYKAFYRVPHSDFSFDIFAASFYLLSRYEEYLPHNKDMYDRYAHENSLAFTEGFLQQPLINIWIQDFSISLITTFPSLVYKLPTFAFLPTYDIDIAWSYKNKGLIRNVGGFITTPSFERAKVLAGVEPDPYDSYDFLHELHSQYNLKPIYFFLVASIKGKYDKNISPENKDMQLLIKEHANKYDVGLHPSWKSNENTDLIATEKCTLETLVGSVVHRSRQHYIKLTLPGTYQELINSGIRDDYSMGYGSINGFRASVASSYYWYDLEADGSTDLRIHPFCFMDANAYYEEKLAVTQALEELNHYFNICKKVNGTCITIFHNNLLGDGVFLEWKKMYSRFIMINSFTAPN